MSTAPKNRLTRSVKRVLDFFVVLNIIALIFLPLLVLVMTVSQQSIPTWGIDIGVFSGFEINLNEFPGLAIESSGIRNPEFSGQAVVNIDTSSLFAFYLWAAITEISGIFGLYVLMQLRAIFASLVRDIVFTLENSGGIKTIGFVVIFWNIINPLLQYFGGRAVLGDMALNVPGLQLYPAFEVNVMGIFVGLALIVLSGVLKEATSIHEDQELTI